MASRKEVTVFVYLGAGRFYEERHQRPPEEVKPLYPNDWVPLSDTSWRSSDGRMVMTEIA